MVRFDEERGSDHGVDGDYASAPKGKVRHFVSSRLPIACAVPLTLAISLSLWLIIGIVIKKFF